MDFTEQRERKAFLVYDFGIKYSVLENLRLTGMWVSDTEANADRDSLCSFEEFREMISY